MSKYAPGPWVVEKRTRVRYDENTGERRADDVSLFIFRSGGGFVAVVNECTPESEANASLMAAAPELLGALKGLIEIGKHDMSNPKYDEYFNLAHAAIAKAEGRDVEDEAYNEVMDNETKWGSGE